MVVSSAMDMPERLGLQSFLQSAFKKYGGFTTPGGKWSADQSLGNTVLDTRKMFSFFSIVIQNNYLTEIRKRYYLES